MRICILGSSCSGKSTLASLLSSKYTIPLLHLDQIYYEKNTQFSPRLLTDFVKAHDEFIKQDSWVVDGNYYRCMPLRFQRATTIIILKISIVRRFFNFFSRLIVKNNRRQGLLQGAEDCFSWQTLFNIVRHSLKMRKYQKLIKNNPHLKMVTLTSYSEIDNFVSNA